MSGVILRRIIAFTTVRNELVYADLRFERSNNISFNELVLLSEHNAY